MLFFFFEFFYVRLILVAIDYSILLHYELLDLFIFSSTFGDSLSSMYLLMRGFYSCLAVLDLFTISCLFWCFIF